MRHVAAGFSILALSLALAGCGGSASTGGSSSSGSTSSGSSTSTSSGSTSSGSTSSSSGSSSSTGSKTLPTVVIGKAVDTIPFTVVDVALAEHFFQKNGVNVKEELVHGSSAANAAMIGGSLQFACEAANPLMLARSHNVPVLSIDALDSGVGLQLVVSTSWLKKHPVAANASFKAKMADLNGAVYGDVSTTDLSFYHLLRNEAGLSPTSGYSTEHIGTQSAISLGMQKGQIDATMQSPPRSIELTAGGYAKDFVDKTDVPSWDNVAYDILTTTSTYAKAHPQITKDVATAIGEGLNFMINHPNQTLAIEKKHFPTLSTTVLKQSLAFIPFAKSGLQSKTGWDNAVSIAQKTGLIKGVTSAPEGVDWTNQYIDTSKVGS